MMINLNIPIALILELPIEALLCRNANCTIDCFYTSIINSLKSA